MPFVLIPFLLLAMPILEIAVFILVGNAIGVWPTIGLVLLTAVMGSLLLRKQGLATLGRIQEETRAGRLPGKDLAEGGMIMSAGILLLVPGFVTDIVGMLLFLPPVRKVLWTFVKRRAIVAATSGRAAPGRSSGQRGPTPPGARQASDVVDLSGEEFSRRPDPSSPWREGDETPPNRTLH